MSPELRALAFRVRRLRDDADRASKAYARAQREVVAELRSRAFSFAEIGELLGITKERAWKVSREVASEIERREAERFALLSGAASHEELERVSSR